MSTPPIIIIADPDTMVRDALRVEFTHRDFAVLIAENGQEAEDFASQIIAHLIVLDIGALRLAAFDACARIRRGRGYKNRPIVLTASAIEARFQAAADEAGATALLRKPYSLDDLFHAVRPHLSANDLLITHGLKARPGGVGEPLEWRVKPRAAARLPDHSALTRNGQLLPIVRRQGVKVPVFRIS